MMQIRRVTRDDIRSEEQRLSAAYAGDATAIAALIERSLMPSRTAVQARIEGECLYLILYGQPGQQDSLVRFIKSGLQQIQIAGVSELDIKVYDAATYSPDQPDAPASAEPVWSYRGRLRQAPPPTPIAAKSIPQSNSPRRVMTGEYSTQWTGHGLRIDATTPGPQRWVPQSATSPAPPELFDRQATLHEAVKVIQAGRILQLYGPSGSGKSALLRNLAHQPAVEQRFGDGVIYVEGYNTPSIDLLQHLFEALYRSDNSVPTKPTLSEIHLALSRRNGLAIVDQIEVADSPDPLLDTLPLVLSAPECILLDHGEVIPLGTFSDHEALTFLEMRLGRSLAPDEQRAAMDLCRHLSGSPALLIQHAEIVRRGRSSFGELSQQIDAGFSPDTLVMRAASDLTDEDRRIMATLAVFGPVVLPPHHLQAIAGVEAISPDLQTRGLVWAAEDNLRLASNLVAPLQQVWDLAPWYERAVQYFSSWATAQHGRIPASGEVPATDTLAALDALWRLVERSAQQQIWTDTIQLCHALDPLLYQYCRWGRWQQVWTFGRQAAQAKGDQATEAWALHQLGSAALCLGDSFAAQAYLAEAQQLRLQTDDMVGAALAQHNLNVVRQNLAREAADTNVSSAPAAAFVSMSQQLPYKWLLVGGGAFLAALGAIFSLQATSSELSVRPRLVSFPPQLLSTTSEPRDVVVRNTTGEAVTIDEIVFSGSNPAEEDAASGEADTLSNANFRIQEDCTNGVLLPDATCTIEAQFTPQTVGPQVAAVDIIDDGQTVRTVTLRGVGAVAEAGFKPQPLEFESFILGSEPSVRQATVRNEGAVAFTVARVALDDTSNTTAFSIAADNCTGQTLDTRDTCTVDVAFAPTEAQAFDTTLTVSHQTGSAIWALPISGTAQTAPTRSSPSGPRLGLPSLPRLPGIFTPPAPRQAPPRTPSPAPAPAPAPRAKAALTPSLSAIAFDSRPAGSMQTQRLTLTNSGDGPLYFDTVSLEAEGFTVAGTNCGLLQPGESCDVVVNFSPSEAGDFTGELVISSNISPVTVTVQGTATEVAPPRSPQILEFTASSTTVMPGEGVDLCYDTADAQILYLEEGATTRSLPNQSECITVTPQVTTPYRLIAQSGEERISETVTVVVEEATAPPLLPPVSLSPGTPSGTDTVSCAAGLMLQWSSASAAATQYEVVLQQEAIVEGQAGWTTVATDTVSGEQLDVSGQVTEFGLHRWQVRPLDEAGNASEASDWHYFLCGI